MSTASRFASWNMEHKTRNVYFEMEDAMHQLTALLIGIVGALIGAIAGAIFMRSYFLAKLTQWVKIHQKHNDQITITVLLVYYKQRLIDWYPKIP